MSINVCVQFSVLVEPDGTSTTASLPLASTPFGFAVTSGYAFSNLFNLVTSKPSDVINVASQSGPSVSAASLDADGTHLELTFSSAPTSQTQVTGQFVF